MREKNSTGTCSHRCQGEDGENDSPAKAREYSMKKWAISCAKCWKESKEEKKRTEIPIKALFIR
jgi:hypothetical protein